MTLKHARELYRKKFFLLCYKSFKVKRNDVWDYRLWVDEARVGKEVRNVDNTLRIPLRRYIPIVERICNG